MTNPRNSSRIFKVYAPAILLTAVAIGLIIGALALMRATELKKAVTTFAECRAAGGSVMESYPEQCSIGGRTYVNERQLSVGSEYVGLSEADALAKAKDENVIARVVERDGDGMTVTMDFLLNRHNLYVKNGKVYKVDVEGVAKDTPADTAE